MRYHQYDGMFANDCEVSTWFENASCQISRESAGFKTLNIFVSHIKEFTLSEKSSRGTRGINRMENLYFV